MTQSKWAENEVKIASEVECGVGNEEFDYGVSCYKSALKAFKSLCKDGHSGLSFGITVGILRRLCEGLPLTPIEDTEDVWKEVTCYTEGAAHEYQCTRKSSLFKTIYSSCDGDIIEYQDVEQCYCKDVNTGSTYGSSLVSKIIREMFPITMPYFPTEPLVVMCEEALTDKKNGDFDTVAIYYCIDSAGHKTSINRYFKDGIDTMVEITAEEFAQRKQLIEELKNQNAES